MKEAERRQTQGSNRRILRCGARPFGARTLDGVPPRLSPKGIIPSQRLSFRPGFLGRGLNGRYPPSPVPVQGSTSHPGRNAGRHDAQAAREQAANPPAGTALTPMTRCASAPRPSLERGLFVTYVETFVNNKVTRYSTLPCSGRRQRRQRLQDRARLRRAAVAVSARPPRLPWRAVVQRLLFCSRRGCGEVHGAFRRREVRSGAEREGAELDAVEKIRQGRMNA
jgi:hypothetical protein